MYLFYDPDICNNLHELRKEESYHCTKVLRLSNGDKIFITDGIGNLYECEIIEISQKKTLVKVISVKKGGDKRGYKIHIAIAPTKSNDRTEWFIEKATEIGIDKITPIICEKSERKIVKKERFNRVAEAAMKQSYKTIHPIIDTELTFKKFIVQDFGETKKYIAHCNTDDNKLYLGNLIEKNEDSLILIGPEGDFSKNEIQQAIENNFIPISLGNSRLRTETAGVVACNIASVINLKSETIT